LHHGDRGAVAQEGKERHRPPCPCTDAAGNQIGSGAEQRRVAPSVAPKHMATNSGSTAFGTLAVASFI
jgi:hypothetical protein